ncbi:MAG TPA: ATP-binding cassette domain-containing protein [Chromatiaceae bacterium]|nr:ATP-binding cassette domain-containing protein [Chromatiaceae bacterium]
MPLLQVEGLEVDFELPGGGFLFRRRQTLKAVAGVSFELEQGTTLGIVGESGCGKSTLARAILGLMPASRGQVRFCGQELRLLSRRQMVAVRRSMQIVFQDPLASLDPRMTVGEIIGEPLQVFETGLKRKLRYRRIAAMMERVGLQPSQINRYPHEFSGGQCQRIGIARALILRPKLLTCDEPVSALDVSIQAQIINLLTDLQLEMELGMLFIAHDLAVIKQISHEIMVMYLGRVVEHASRESLFNRPRHPYTQALLEAIPIPDPQVERSKRIVPLAGDLPSPLDPPSGCHFRTRCPRARSLCAEKRPQMREFEVGHFAACHYPE